MSTTPEILRTAADVLRERGLYKGLYIAEHGDPATACVCTYGALYIAAGATPHVIAGTDDILLIGHEVMADEQKDAVYLATQALDKVLRRRQIALGIINWNDEDDTTVEDVIDLLTATADELEVAA